MCYIDGHFRDMKLSMDFSGYLTLIAGKGMTVHLVTWHEKNDHE